MDSTCKRRDKTGDRQMKVFAILMIVCAAMMIGTAGLADEDAGGQCVTCHKEITPGLYNQWYMSSHAQYQISCIDCHAAKKEDSDAFEHEGVMIATLVTPQDCGGCHDTETQEMENSYHATAGLILESQDAYLAYAAAGQPVAIQGCESCHGAKMVIDPQSSNKLSPLSWPNSGIGRINPDGSKGSCNACHTRHSFSRAQARQPEACSKCHLGPDHPQKEIYEESKHGNTYNTNKDKMNLSSASWVVGQDYYVAPTCATCHMSATPGQAVSHDVGRRIAWTLRPPISTHKDDWQQKRANMTDVCTACHGNAFVEGHFYQFDAVVRLYNERFAKPAGEIMNLVRQNNLLANKAEFGNNIEWTYWELWHHEGRRARHGAAMMGPDYTWWHGFYEVAKHFYFTLIPEARTYNNTQVNSYIDSLLTNDAMHAWLSKDTEVLRQDIRSGKMQEMFKRFFENK